MLISDADTGYVMNPNSENGRNESYPFILRKPLISGLQTEESLKKVDSFSRWIAKELGEADELDMQSSNGISWSFTGNDYDTLNPSISQDQLFSIIDFTPTCAYSNLETKVLGVNSLHFVCFGVYN